MAEVIVERKPWSRGVTQLMYVGDDGEPPAPPRPTTAELAAGAAAAAVALKTKGLTRGIATGIAVWVGIKAYRAYRADPGGL